MAMENRLNMSLDDLIKINKTSSGRGGGNGGGGGGRGRGGGSRGQSGAAPSRRFNNRVSNRSTPYSRPIFKAPDTFWQHDMFGNQGSVGGVGGASSIETGTKLYISNLDYGVSNDDIKELFSEVGDLKRYSVHYDRSGRSKGTAEVVFSRKGDGLAAVSRYNNVELDGKPMKIEIVGTNLQTVGALPPVFNDNGRNPAGSRSGPARVGAMGRIRGGRGFGRGRGRGRGRDEKASVSADDLDADLEKYHSEAMQTN